VRVADHAVHVVAAIAARNVPAGQYLQRGLPVPLSNVPISHGLHWSDEVSFW
jgi:hypothetical protein